MIKILPDVIGDKVSLLVEVGPWNNRVKVQLDMTPTAAGYFARDLTMKVEDMARIKDDMKSLERDASAD